MLFEVLSTRLPRRGDCFMQQCRETLNTDAGRFVIDRLGRSDVLGPEYPCVAGLFARRLAAASPSSRWDALATPAQFGRFQLQQRKLKLSRKPIHPTLQLGLCAATGRSMSSDRRSQRRFKKLRAVLAPYESWRRPCNAHAPRVYSQEDMLELCFE